MFSGAIQDALNATQNILQAAVGDRLQATVVYGDLVGGYFQPGESSVELLALIDGDVPWEKIWLAYRPVWQQYHHLLGRGPNITTTTSWRRYATLNPNFVHQLEQNGGCLFGELPGHGVAFDATFAYAQYCQRALAASAILAPDLLHEEAKAMARRQLRQLGRELIKAPAGAESDLELFSQIQARLSTQAQTLGLTEPDPGQQEDAPPDLPHLRAIFEKIDQLILLLPRLTAEDVNAVNWPEIAKLVAANYGSLHVTTPLQLQTASKYVTPIAILLRHYEHAWGQDLLSELTVAQGEVLFEAARHAATISLEDMTAAYFQAPAESLGKLVHDYQNKLLNVQLQHELFHRLLGLDKVAPDLPLPGRGTSYHARVSATLFHLNWWSDHYLSLI